MQNFNKVVLVLVLVFIIAQQTVLVDCYRNSTQKGYSLSFRREFLPNLTVQTSLMPMMRITSCTPPPPLVDEETFEPMLLPANREKLASPETIDTLPYPPEFRRLLKFFYVMRLVTKTGTQDFVFNPDTFQYDINPEVFLKIIRYRRTSMELFELSEKRRLEALEEPEVVYNEIQFGGSFITEHYDETFLQFIDKMIDRLLVGLFYSFVTPSPLPYYAYL